ncbi:MAG: IS200/IS605 family transposase [Thermomicrobiales bacterium]|nr:IS200/IS605 family transposase [Thermomicrobiales bacterium]
MSYWRLFYHLVWATKDREPVLDDARSDLLVRSIQALCTENRVLVHATGVMPDHIHLALSIPPRIAIAEFVQRMKGTTSRRFNTTASRTDIEHFDWQPEYGVISFGERSLDEVVAYLENQRTHHANQTIRPLFERTERLYERPGAVNGASHP